MVACFLRAPFLGGAAEAPSVAGCGVSLGFLAVAAFFLAATFFLAGAYLAVAVFFLAATFFLAVAVFFLAAAFFFLAAAVFFLAATFFLVGMVLKRACSYSGGVLMGTMKGIVWSVLELDQASGTSCVDVDRSANGDACACNAM